jgi:O-antigen/teichoic acid export membrane protein
VYWATAALIAALMLLVGPSIATVWLKPAASQQSAAAHAVALMGVVIACRWPISLYQGVLNGLQRLTLASGIAVGMTSLASIGAICILAFMSPTIEAFFLWQALVGLANSVCLQRLSWSALGGRHAEVFDADELRRVWRYSLGMGGIAVTALLFTQLDKVLLSKFVGLADFGRYALASTVVAGLYVLVAPMFNAIYPRFSQLVALGQLQTLTELYRLGTRILALVLFPVAVVLAMDARELVYLWTADAQLAAAVAPLIALLAVGSALHGVLYFPFALQLACGEPGITLRINVILLVVQLPVVITLAYLLGALGGAISWLLLHVLNLLLSTLMTHRRLLPGIGARWLTRDVGIPLVSALLLAAVLRYGVLDQDWGALIKLLTAAALGLATIAVSLATSPRVCSTLSNAIRTRA